MKRHRVTAALSAVLLTLSLTACGGTPKQSEEETQAAETFGTAVQVQRVSAENIATDNKVSGRVVAEDEATVMVGVSAKCVAVYKDAGDNVRKGDVLCRLDLASTISQYNASQISYESAIQQYNDQKSLFDEQIAIAEKSVETAAQQIAVQRQQIAAQEQNITVQEGQIPVTEQQIANAEANLPVTERQIANAEANLPVQERQIANAEAALPVSEKQLDAMEEQVAAQAANIPVTEQQITLVETQLAQAKKNVSDTEALFRIGAASQMELDNAKLAADQVSYQLEQLRVGLSSAEAQLTQSRAQLESQRTALDSSRTQIEAQKVALENARTQIQAQKVGLENARTQIQAQKVGLEQAKAGIEASKVQIEQLKLALTQYESQRDNAQLSVNQLKSTRSSTLSQLEAGIENARSGLQQLDSVLEDVDDDGNVIAPISGTLVTFNAVENSYVSNAMPLAVIHGETEMKVTASVSEALAPKLTIGDSADVYVSALDLTMSAVIRSVERAANAQTRLYAVTLTLSEPSSDLLAGMFADVTFHTDRVNNAIVAPSEAILTNGDTHYVYVAVGSKAKYVEVTTGLTGAGVTEILSGLDGGEYLITVGQTYVSDGADIRIVGGL